MKISLLLLTLSLLSSCGSGDLDGIYPLDSTIPESSKIENTLKDVKADTTMISGSMENEKIISENVDEDSVNYTPFQTSGTLDVDQKYAGITSNPGVLGDHDSAKNFLEYDDKALLRKAGDKGETDFQMTYFFSNDYSVSGRNGIYETIFEGENSKNYGPLMFGFHKFISKGSLEPFYGLNFGFNYDEGRASFSGGGLSDATFKLWMIPVDVALGVDFNLGNFAKVGIMGGPSIMGLFQSRSDFEEDEPLKRRRQVGLGYFAGASAKISLSQIFTGYGFELYRDNDVTQMFFTLDFRMVNYSSFQDDITIDGSAMGAGFTFEFL